MNPLFTEEKTKAERNEVAWQALLQGKAEFFGLLVDVTPYCAMLCVKNIFCHCYRINPKQITKYINSH